MLEFLPEIVACVYSVACGVALCAEGLETIVCVSVKRVVGELARIDSAADCERGMPGHFVGKERIEAVRQVEQRWYLAQLRQLGIPFPAFGEAVRQLPA